MKKGPELKSKAKTDHSRISWPQTAESAVSTRISPAAALAFLIVLTLYISGCTLNFTEADVLLPSKQALPPAPVASSFQRLNVTVTHPDGNISSGTYLYSPTARGTVIFFQGNGETINCEGDIRLWNFERMNLNVYVFDRRGYGQTSGKTSFNYLSSDAIEIFDFVRPRVHGKLLVHGFSLGSMQASYIAKHRNVDALVIEATTISIREYINTQIPWFVLPFTHLEIPTSLEQVNAIDSLKEYKGPILIAAGENDTKIPPEQSKRLFDMISSDRKELVIVPHAPHKALITDAGYAAYEAFVQKAFP